MRSSAVACVADGIRNDGQHSIVLFGLFGSDKNGIPRGGEGGGAGIVVKTHGGPRKNVYPPMCTRYVCL